nr:MAG TPA: hypothetical protein [Bacteriophage sp.]
MGANRLSLQIRPPYRDGNIERASYSSKAICSKWLGVYTSINGTSKKRVPFNKKGREHLLILNY